MPFFLQKRGPPLHAGLGGPAGRRSPAARALAAPVAQRGAVDGQPLSATIFRGTRVTGSGAFTHTSAGNALARTMGRTRAPPGTPRDGLPPRIRAVAQGYFRIGRALQLDRHVGPWVLTPFFFGYPSVHTPPLSRYSSNLIPSIPGASPRSIEKLCCLP